jgi:zinc finger protein
MIVNCPVCGGVQTAESTIKTENIPYFGEIMESSIVCNSCGFKHNDTIILDQKDPVRYELKLSKDALSSRVIKSQSATVSIPEFGLKVEPGPKSIAYVSNVEGVLIRFKDAVNQSLILFYEDKSAQKKGKAILESLNKALKGDSDATLIIEDPFGQSKIMDIKAKYRKLTDEELKDLKTSFLVFDASEIE